LRKLEEEQNSNIALRRRADEALTSKEELEAAKSKVEAERSDLEARLESVSTLLKAEKEKFLEQTSQIMVLEQRTFECEADALVNAPAYNLHLLAVRGRHTFVHSTTHSWRTASWYNGVALYCIHIPQNVKS
jgi:hypothetical protein